MADTKTVTDWVQVSEAENWVEWGGVWVSLAPIEVIEPDFEDVFEYYLVRELKFHAQEYTPSWSKRPIEVLVSYTKLSAVSMDVLDNLTIKSVADNYGWSDTTSFGRIIYDLLDSGEGFELWRSEYSDYDNYQDQFDRLEQVAVMVADSFEDYIPLED